MIQAILSSLQLGSHRSMSTAHTWDSRSHLAASPTLVSLQEEQELCAQELFEWKWEQCKISCPTEVPSNLLYPTNLRERARSNITNSPSLLRCKLDPAQAPACQVAPRSGLDHEDRTEGMYSPSLEQLSAVTHSVRFHAAISLTGTAPLKYSLLWKGEPLAEKQIRAEACMLQEGPDSHCGPWGSRESLCPTILDSLSWLRTRLAARQRRNHGAPGTVPAGCRGVCVPASAE